MIAKSNGRMTPAVAYYRMSTDRQDKSIPEQRTEVEKLAAREGYRILREYLDEGISGDTTEKRHDFLRMIRDAQSMEFQAILVWDIDRFGRFDSLEAGYWCKPLRDAGVRLVSIAQGMIDWSDFASRILYGINTEAKNAYLADLSRNVIRGHVSGASRGEWCGGMPPYGYNVDPASKRLILGDATKVAIVQSVYDDYLKGESLRGIARRINANGIPSPAAGTGRRCCGRWTANAVRSVLTNPLYTGDYHWNRRTKGKQHRIAGKKATPAVNPKQQTRANEEDDWISVKDNHPAIVNREIFNAVQRRLKVRQKHTTPLTEPRMLMTGLLRCAHCGYPMNGTTKEGGYICRGYQTYGRAVCHRYMVKEATIVDLVCSVLERKLLDPRSVRRLRAEIRRQLERRTSPKDIQPLQRQLAGIEGKLQKARRRLAEVDTDMLQEVQCAIRTLRREKEVVESALNTARMPRQRLQRETDRDVETALAGVSGLREIIKRATVRQAKEALATAVERVELRFRTEQHGSRRRYFLEGGQLTLATDYSSRLFDTASRRGYPR